MAAFIERTEVNLQASGSRTQSTSTASTRKNHIPFAFVATWFHGGVIS